MTRKYQQISPSDSVISVAACGSASRDIPAPDNSMLAAPPGVDLAAEAAALEACQVSALLASGMLSLTNLTSDAMPRLLHRA